MSRIGRRIINIPENVQFEIDSFFKNVKVAGPLGTLNKLLSGNIKVIVEDNKIVTELKRKNDKNNAIWGTTNALINNWIEGVTKGFSKKLIINGLGYKALLKGDELELQLGYSHLIFYKIPKEITIEVTRNTQVLIKGIDKEQVGFVASQIRKFKKPEPYKGKGIIYEGEQIIRKVGKTGSSKK